MIIGILNNSKKDSFISDKHNVALKMIREYQNLGTTIAITLTDEALAIGGVGRIHKGVGTAWMVVNNLFKKYPKTMVKMCRQIINESGEFLNLHRMQMDIDLQYKENVRFAKCLGFKEEGLMVSYGPHKEDYARYVKIIG